MEFRTLKNPGLNSGLNSGLTDVNSGPNTRIHEIHIPQLVVVDSRACLREALSKSLQEHFDNEIISVESAATLRKFQTTLRESGAVIVYSYGVHNRETDISNIKTIQTLLPSCRIVLMTSTLDFHVYDIFIEFGLNGVIPSSFTTDQLVACLHMIDSGVSFLPSDTFKRHAAGFAMHHGADGFKMPNLNGKLTPRQQEVMRYIAIGKSNKYIAAELDLCESTVKVHVSELMRRLGATSRTHASYIIGKLAYSNSEKTTDDAT